MYIKENHKDCFLYIYLQLMSIKIFTMLLIKKFKKLYTFLLSNLVVSLSVNVLKNLTGNGWEYIAYFRDEIKYKVNIIFNQWNSCVSYWV